ncbi:GAF domain-containing protein [Acidocella aromatica]|uniref:GAF domain-containing protein n=1 Tax=Acidocella aromatica TaxID=1303579 RepID=A0A840VD22_9PROT|nr:GAF domain-containing protein [Acidocella aromatica]MBB5373778.1 GAF domain-containing protein [Acidocella aromatica]
MSPSKEQMPRYDRAIIMLKQAQAEIDGAAKLADLYTRVCEVVVGLGGYCMAWIGLAENDAAKSVHPVAYTGYESGYLEATNITWSTEETGLGPTGTAIRERRIQINNSTSESPRMAVWRDEALKRGYAASIALPLKEKFGEAFGALMIYSLEEDAFGPEEVHILSQLADKLSAAVVNLRYKAREALGFHQG